MEMRGFCPTAMIYSKPGDEVALTLMIRHFTQDMEGETGGAGGWHCDGTLQAFFNGRATPKNARVSVRVGAPSELHQRSVCVHVCAIRSRKERERRKRERGRKE